MISDLLDFLVVCNEEETSSDTTADDTEAPKPEGTQDGIKTFALIRTDTEHIQSTFSNTKYLKEKGNNGWETLGVSKEWIVSEKKGVRFD